MGVIGLMERFLKCLAFVIISILIFNFSIVYAEETTEENETADVQVSDEIRREENTTGTSNETNTTDVILDAPEGNSTAYVEDTNMENAKALLEVVDNTKIERLLGLKEFIYR